MWKFMNNIKQFYRLYVRRARTETEFRIIGDQAVDSWWQSRESPDGGFKTNFLVTIMMFISRNVPLFSPGS